MAKSTTKKQTRIWIGNDENKVWSGSSGKRYEITKHESPDGGYWHLDVINQGLPVGGYSVKNSALNRLVDMLEKGDVWN